MLLSREKTQREREDSEERDRGGEALAHRDDCYGVESSRGRYRHQAALLLPSRPLAHFKPLFLFPTILLLAAPVVYASSSSPPPPPLSLKKFWQSLGFLSCLPCPHAPDMEANNALLKDLYEKKQNLRRIASEVGSMASELRDVRGRMAAQESTLEQEISRRQAAEAKAKGLEKELETLHRTLEERNSHAMSTASVAEQYLRELVDVRTRLGSAQEAADASAASAVAAQLQCKNLLKEIEKKTQAVQEQEALSSKLSQQLAELQHEVKLRESSQNQLKEEIGRLEAEIKLAVALVAAKKDAECKKSLEETSARNAEQMSKHLAVKDEEIARLKEEIKATSAQLKTKTQELEIQVEKHRASDQDLKKRIIKLEFWLQEARMQTRKLQRIGEKREKELQDLRAQLASNPTSACKRGKLWDNPRFKIIMSVSSLVMLVMFAKR